MLRNIGMRVILASKDCVRMGIVKSCPCMVESIVLADNETVPPRLVAGQPHSLEYMPISLLLRAEGATWILPRGDLPASLPKDMLDYKFGQMFHMRIHYKCISTLEAICICT